MNATPLRRTGFRVLDEARRPRRAATGIQLLSDPTEAAPGSRFPTFGCRKTDLDLQEIDDAYRVDSFARQGVDKYVELVTKHGWYLDAETPEPREYVEQRLRLMAIMTDKPTHCLVDEGVLDFIKYGNWFLLKYRGKLKEPYPGIPEQGAGNSPYPVLGYYRADPKRMKPAYSKDGKRRVGWEYTRPDGSTKIYYRGDVIHFPYNVQAGEIWGSPHLQPVLDDIRSYRQAEEFVLLLLEKHLTPLLHHEVPDLSGTGYGRQDDVDAAAASHQIMAKDGMIITPPGHKINMIGAESRAVRGEGYMEMLRARVYAGLGVSKLVMGEGDSVAAGSADALTLSMHNKAKFYQHQLSALLEHHVLMELLLEGGFDPTKEIDRVQWVWEEIEIEAQIKRENHNQQLFTNNVIDEDEVRRTVRRKPMTDEQYARTHVFRNKIPPLEAAADARARAQGADGPARQGASRDNPSNQHGSRGGPKVRPR